jgi:hypothetical protein
MHACTTHTTCQGGQILGHLCPVVLELGFEPLNAYPCIYVCWENKCVAIIRLYINDCLILTHPELLKQTKEVLSRPFPMKDHTKYPHSGMRDGEKFLTLSSIPPFL